MIAHCSQSHLKLLFVTLACALCFVGSGCQTTYSTHQLGEHRVVAKYGGRSLFVEVPETVRVPAVIAAADEVVRSRGYSVLRKESTEEKGMIASVPPAKDTIQRVIVRAEAGDHGTAIRVSYEPFPDRRLCESILDAILAKLSTN
jgi:hypothetical protein